MVSDMGHFSAFLSRQNRFIGIHFPSQTRIMRYLEEYGATLDITRLEINTSPPDSTFVLDRPAGSTLQVIGRE
jgi:hypothetical protein